MCGRWTPGRIEHDSSAMPTGKLFNLKQGKMQNIRSEKVIFHGGSFAHGLVATCVLLGEANWWLLVANIAIFFVDLGFLRRIKT